MLVRLDPGTNPLGEHSLLLPCLKGVLQPVPILLQTMRQWSWASWAFLSAHCLILPPERRITSSTRELVVIDPLLGTNQQALAELF